MKINEQIVSKINAILEYGEMQKSAIKSQDFLQARVYRDKKAFQFESLLEHLVDLRNLLNPDQEQLSKEDFVVALGGIVNLSKKSSLWE